MRFYSPSLHGEASDWVNPIEAFRSLQREMNQLFEKADVLHRPSPAVNVAASPESVEIWVLAPGADQESFDISVHGTTLTLRGKTALGEFNETACIRREFGEREFERRFELPYAIDEQSVEATYADGILHLELPRAAETKPRKIEVKAS